MTSILHDPGRSRSPFLHVANGSSTTNSIDAAGIPGRLSIWADPLHDGPVPGGVSDDELVAVRAGWLAQSELGDVGALTAELQAWRRAIADVGTYDELVLWFEHDLFDQLNLIQVLDFIAGLDPSPAVVGLVCIDRHPAHPRFKGLGELTPAELAPLLATRVPVTPEQFDVARRAWKAFRSPDPRDVAALIAGDTAPLPFLGPALARLLEEFPSTADGLSRTERRLLTRAAAGSRTLVSLMREVHEGESVFYIADSSLLDVARGLCRTAPPLLAMPREDGDGVSGTMILPTAAGVDVLAGRADRVSDCGIDRAIGGVRLEGRGPVWRWDPGSRALTWR